MLNKIHIDGMKTWSLLKIKKVPGFKSWGLADTNFGSKVKYLDTRGQFLYPRELQQVQKMKQVKSQFHYEQVNFWYSLHD